MVSDRFSILIDELGQALKMKLKPDANQACMIRYPDGLQVRIDPDRVGEMIFMFCDLGTVPQGRYRENIFREALKANALPAPRVGIFSFNQKRESLVLFDQMAILDLNGIRLADMIQSFAEKARIWKDGLTRGEVPSFRSSEMSTKSSGSGIFGLR